MDEMTAFERQMAGGLRHMGGAGRSIDPTAMARTAATTSPKWRFGSMFSATKFVAASVIVALFGGLLLIGQPAEPQHSSAPGASTDEAPAAPVAFTGNIFVGRCSDGEITELEGNVRRSVNAPCGQARVVEMSDPRLEGEVIFTSNHDFHRAALDGSTPQVRVTHWVMDIVNAEGAWRGHPAVWVRVPGADPDISTTTGVFLGDGAYEGLVAVAEIAPAPPGNFDLRGFIIDGETPAAPSNLVAE